MHPIELTNQNGANMRGDGKWITAAMVATGLALATICCPAIAGTTIHTTEPLARIAIACQVATVRVTVSGHWGNVMANIGFKWGHHNATLHCWPIVPYPTVIITGGYTYIHGFVSPYWPYRRSPYWGQRFYGRPGVRTAMLHRQLTRRPARELTQKSSRRSLNIPTLTPVQRKLAKERKLRRLTTPLPDTKLQIAEQPSSVNESASTASELPRYRQTRFSEPINYFGAGRTIDDLYD